MGVAKNEKNEKNEKDEKVEPPPARRDWPSPNNWPAATFSLPAPRMGVHSALLAQKSAIKHSVVCGHRR
jgi:hypothetical protein